MASWGDYAITAVRYNHDDTRIKKVERKEVTDILTNTEKVSRSKVVESIESGHDHTTAIKNPKTGKWSLGDEVHILEIHGEKFIRTDQNNTEEDNLGDLPTF